MVETIRTSLVAEFRGDDSFKTVKGVDVWGSEEAPPGMGLAKGTRSEDTDAALQNLTVMNQLQRLYLSGSHITDAGLGNLKESNQLQSLDLHEAKVTDAGLENLKQLHQLQWLDINGTDQITDAGLANLQGLNQLRALYLSGTHVTDAGLEYLQAFTQLQTLTLAIPKSQTLGSNTSEDSPTPDIERWLYRSHGCGREETPTGIAELHDYLLATPRTWDCKRRLVWYTCFAVHVIQPPGVRLLRATGCVLLSEFAPYQA